MPGEVSLVAMAREVVEPYIFEKYVLFGNGAHMSEFSDNTTFEFSAESGDGYFDDLDIYWEAIGWNGEFGQKTRI